MMTSLPPQIHPQGKYTATEAARLLGISRRTLSRWVLAGKVRKRYSKATMMPRYLGKDLLALWNNDV